MDGLNTTEATNVLAALSERYAQTRYVQAIQGSDHSP